MDRALKERITGAVVLVVIAVLVVPVFLDGAPTETEIMTQTVTLPGQEDQRRKQQTIVLERDRDQPVPAGSARDTPIAQSSVEPAPAVSREETSPPPAAAQPQPEPAAPAEKQDASEPVPEAQQEPTRVAQSGAGDVAPAAAESESATGMWAVQLGSFSNPDNAQRLASELRTNGYAAFLSRLKTADGALHRVRVGPQKDRDSAEAVAKRLSGDGHDGQVVPHP